MKIDQKTFNKIFEYGTENSGKTMFYIFTSIYESDIAAFKKQLCQIDLWKWEKHFPLLSVKLHEGIGFIENGVYHGSMTIALEYADGTKERKTVSGTFTPEEKAKLTTIEHWKS